MGGKARSPHAADGDGIMERKEGGEEGLVVSEVVAARISQWIVGEGHLVDEIEVGLDGKTFLLRITARSGAVNATKLE